MKDRDSAVREFVRQLTACQPRLYAYIVTLVLDCHQADDVLQTTNLVMWGKLDKFIDCEDFNALACRVAYLQVLAHRRDRLRQRRWLLFDEQLLEGLAATARAKTADFEPYLAALRGCVAELPATQRELVRKRYGSGGSVKEIAAASGSLPNVVSAMLYRIRKSLLACIRGKIAGGASE